ncbi:MAG: GAF domain-containing sensor histidine kinase [Anaerolineales bacterium]|jgi:signal transduction histidine kinase/GAF domain-containing protein
MAKLNTDSRLLEALASLNEIGATVNQIGLDGMVSVETTLNLIVQSAIRVVPGASTVIYTYDVAKESFILTSRVSAGGKDQPDSDDEPRSNGLGIRAIIQRRRVLSYEEKDIQIHPVRAKAGANVTGCFPLVVANRPVGVLYVYLQEDRQFSQLELLMLDNFVNQAAMAIYHAHNLAMIQHDLARKEEELVRLRRAGLLISSRLRLEETLESILQMALEVTGAHYGIFRLLDKSGQFLNTRAVAGEHMARPLIEALPLDSNSVMAWVARGRQVAFISDLREEPWSQIYYPLDASLEMRSELAVPLIGASGRLEGVLNLESPAVGAFSEEDSHLLQALATQAVITIQEVSLLDALQEVAHLLLTQPCQKVLTHVADLACTLLDAATSAIWTLKGEDLVLEASSGGYQHGDTIPLQNSLAGQAVKNRSAVISEDVRMDERFHRVDLARSQNWARALIVPLLPGDEDKPLGAFGVYSSNAALGHFAESEWDKKVLVCLADYAVLAFQNAARQEALRASQEQRSVAETFAAVGDIASNLLHHLNNKVGTIPVRIQGIEDKCQDTLAANPYLSHNLDEIERCATEAMESVRESLSHLRPIRLEPVFVEARVADAIQFTKLPPGIDVRLDKLDRLPMVMAGERTLTLVFTNLIENAVDAMEGHGTILIGGSTDGDWVNIIVSDNGPGIAPNLHDHIFELDYSGRGAIRPGKLGFGLWWVKTLMTRLGGFVSVESDGIRGTTFHLRLPRTEKPVKLGEN